MSLNRLYGTRPASYTLTTAALLTLVLILPVYWSLVPIAGLVVHHLIHRALDRAIDDLVDEHRAALKKIAQKS